MYAALMMKLRTSSAPPAHAGKTAQSAAIPLKAMLTLQVGSLDSIMLLLISAAYGGN